MNCRTRLKLLSLVPVFSYLFLKCRCRYCGEHISIRYAAVELITPIIYLTLLHKFGYNLEFAAMAFLMSILIVVFFIDLEHKIIPNGLVITGLAGGIVFAAYNIFYSVSILGDRSWWNPLLGMGVGLRYFIPYRPCWSCII